MIEVFKTNVADANHSKRMTRKLLEHFPESRVDFDLEDCDRVLRVEGDRIIPVKVIEILRSSGFSCVELE